MSPAATAADGLRHTYCRLCEAQCGLVAKVEEGRITYVGPDREHVTSNGHLCVKGPAMMHITYDPDRVLTPLRRAGGPGEFEPVGWDEALDDIAGRLASIVDRDGPDAMGVYFGNPAAFGFRHMAFASRFARAFGSSKIFNPVHVDTGSKSLACQLVYGPGHPYTFPDLEDCDVLLMVGANPMVSHMSLVSEPRVLQKLEAVSKRGAVVVVDPRRTETARRFEHVPVLPDSDAWLLAGMLNVIFAEGLAKEDLLDARVEGWRSLRDALAAIPLQAAAARCHVPPEQIAGLARRFAGARTAACYGRLGSCRGSFPTLVNVLIEALNIVTGRFATRGGWITGASPFSRKTPPRSIYDQFGPPKPYGEARSRVGGLPLLGGFQPGGSLADDILTPGDGQLRALFVDSGNPVMAYPGSSKIERALGALELFVALDFYVTESTRHAHYILPSTTFFERADLTELHVLNAPRPWVQYTDAVIPPMGQSRLELGVYNDILVRAGRPPLLEAGDRSPEAALLRMMDELLADAPAGDGVGGLTAARLRDEFPSGLRFVERADAEGGWDRVAYVDGKPRLWNEIIAGEAARLVEATRGAGDHRLKLFGRRKLRSLNSWMHNDMRIVRSDRPTLLMHPDDARERQVADGGLVRVASDHGVLEVEVEFSDDVIPGSVCYPHGWGHAGGWTVANGLPGRNVNELASGDPQDWEQVSGMCLVDGVPVDVAPLPAALAAARIGDRP
ncbi:molybdopterin-dependent oxidoreductase [Phenylobacterium sp.]|uniref:molybdopterin-containing oxidoreductase family protein n=1 Tax=Phenylobacterium sp. TaxID=1871053 RepID=UPI00301E0B13